MFDPETQSQLRETVRTSLIRDRRLLDDLRSDVRPLRAGVRHIPPRTTTSISLVAADGGNNSLRFDPFLVQIVRVVDSSNNEYCLEAVTPTTDVDDLSRRQFDAAGRPETALGELMESVGARTISELSPMIRRTTENVPTNTAWIEAYRELIEWAVLFRIVRTRAFAANTLIVYDGLLRTFYMDPLCFRRFKSGLEEAIDRHWTESRRRIFLVGVAKSSKVLERYRLALSLENVLTCAHPAYVEVPLEIEEKAYLYAAFTRGDRSPVPFGRVNENIAGRLHFVKFGSRPRDPIWPVDLFSPQIDHTSEIMSYLLGDAQNGFPVPFYPLCLQQAHANAALVEFDFDLLQDYVFEGIRDLLGDEAPALDTFRLAAANPAAARYG